MLLLSFLVHFRTTFGCNGRETLDSSLSAEPVEQAAELPAFYVDAVSYHYFSLPCENGATIATIRSTVHRGQSHRPGMIVGAIHLAISDYVTSSVLERSEIIGGMASNDTTAIATIVVSIPYLSLSNPKAIGPSNPDRLETE